MVITFRVNGIRLFLHNQYRSVSSNDVDPSTTLLEYIRNYEGLKGTKYMCQEGGCGACIVTIQKEHPVTKKSITIAVNSCLVSIFSCEGWKIQTVESIGNKHIGYHPVQNVLAKFNGTQCGFCSPGMVMNMHALYESNPNLTMQDVEDSFGSNMCRCTGYRSILTAFKSLCKDANTEVLGTYPDIEDVTVCNTQTCTKPCFLKNDQNLGFCTLSGFSNTRWYKVFSINEIFDVFSANPIGSYQLVAGNTAKGVYPDYYTRFNTYIDITRVVNLMTDSLTKSTFVVGASKTLNDTIELFRTTANLQGFDYLNQLAKHISLIAHVAVRNIGTIAGNLSIKHDHKEFPSDIFLILETVGAKITLVVRKGIEEEVDLLNYLKYDIKHKVIKNVILPKLDTTYKFQTYKIMPRAQNAHAMVNAGFLIKLKDNQTVLSARIVYGGINPDFVHASIAESYLINKNIFDDATLQGVFRALSDDVNPDNVLPEPSPEFRKKLAISLFYKFILSIAPKDKVSPKYKSGGFILERPISKGVQDYQTNQSLYPLTQPINKLEALGQVSGEVEYVTDLSYNNQLYAAFVTAKAPKNSVILKIDPSDAQKQDGVIAFYKAKDIPGMNLIIPLNANFPPGYFPKNMSIVPEELFCSGTVAYYNQPVGIIVGKTQKIADNAANLVNITFNTKDSNPLLTIKQILDSNALDKIVKEAELKSTTKGNDIKHVIKGCYESTWQYHYHMETQVCNVVPTDIGLDVHSGTQWMDLIQTSVASVLKIKENKVNVIVKRLGGGFGAKIIRSAVVASAAALAACKLQKPVKLGMSFTANMDVIGKRFPSACHYEAGVNNKGVIQYLNSDIYLDYGSSGNEPFVEKTFSTFFSSYKHDTWNVSAYNTTTDNHPSASTRAPGNCNLTCMIESIMEHIAIEINISPTDVRLANMNTNDSRDLLRFISEFKPWADYDKRLLAIKEHNEANRWIKKGLALSVMTYPFSYTVTLCSTVAIYAGDGSVVISHGGVEMGQGINTKVAQVCAFSLKIPLSMVSVKPSNNVTSPNVFATATSLTSETICYATLKACEVLLNRMAPIRAKMNNPTWTELVKECQAQYVELIASHMFSPKDEIKNYSVYGVCGTEVTVDILTGLHQVNRVDLLEDTGDSMNPFIDIGQVEGAFIMGLGFHTTETIVYDKLGRLVTNRTWNYKIPGALDIPADFRVKFPRNNPNPSGILHSKATGEPALCLAISIPLAIRHAVASARRDADSSSSRWYSILSSNDVDPSTTLLEYIRDYEGLRGTKYMCQEGGCGACIVTIKKEHPVTKKSITIAVNSCLVSIFSCEGWTIQTVESIGNKHIGYHPVQNVLAKFNGTQCGFCSPGMVMNMHALYESNPNLTMQDVENSFGSNMCRCTGYRSILTAFKSLCKDANTEVLGTYPDIEDVTVCNTQTCTKPCFLKNDQKLGFCTSSGFSNTRWYKVFSINEIFDVFSANPIGSYQLVAGNTAKGVYPDYYTRFNTYIDISRVVNLMTDSLTKSTFVVGASKTLNDTIELFRKTANLQGFDYLNQLARHISLIAHVAVRNIGTIAGNLSIKHDHKEFPSDIFLILETVGSKITLVVRKGKEEEVDLLNYLKYDIRHKVIKNIILPKLDTTYKFQTYKIMPRAQNAHAMVNAGFLIKLKDNQTVLSARIVYGGINPDFVHASKAESYLINKNIFDDDTLQGVFRALSDDVNPDNVLPDPSPEFRKKLAISLFYKFILSIAPKNKVSPKYKSGGFILERPISKGVQDYQTNQSLYPLTQPINKLEALGQVSGEVEYVTDLSYNNQLYAAFVTAKAPKNSVILKIDSSGAQKEDGVLAFYKAKDIPGVNLIIPLNANFPPGYFPKNKGIVREELFCSGTVAYYNQPVGIIVGKTQKIADNAANLVNITFNTKDSNPLLTIKQILDSNALDKIVKEAELKSTTKGNDIKHVIKGCYESTWQYHYHMETQVCNVMPTDIGLDVHSGTQWMDLIQISVASVLKIQANKVNVIVKRLGGGFGAKIIRSAVVASAAALAAYKLQKPVKLGMSFTANMDVIGKRYPSVCHYEAGVNNKGVIQYLNSDIYLDYGSSGNETVLHLTFSSFFSSYKHDTWNVSAYNTRTDNHPSTWTRAPGNGNLLCMIESIMEHIAMKLNISPTDVRLANMNTNDSRDLLRFISEFKHWADYDKRLLAIKEHNEANRWIKKGLALSVMTNPMAFFFTVCSTVAIYAGDGSVVISHGGVEMGQGINTKVAQVCAFSLKIPLSMVSVTPSNNVTSPNVFATSASLTSETICYATLKACEILLNRMAPIRAKMNNPTWIELVKECQTQFVELIASHMFSPNDGIKNYNVYGVCGTEVTVDILTGLHQINRVDLLEDTGDSMNPFIDIGQVEGAFIMGLGFHTTETIVYDKLGRLVTNRTWNYKIPGALDIPADFRVKFPRNNPNPNGILHSKATGEPPFCLAISIPLAIRHAVASARRDADSSSSRWYSISGPSNVESVFNNSLNDYKQYKL